MQPRLGHDWTRVLEVNVMGMVHVAQAVASGMVAFLSSARADQVTGQTINVDGGQVMHC
jgi:NADP-dependent 3-hydroxy acid dehydrogenase YdfG